MKAFAFLSYFNKDNLSKVLSKFLSKNKCTLELEKHDVWPTPIQNVTRFLRKFGGDISIDL